MQKQVRLLKIWKLCHERRRHPRELAKMCGVTERTIYRDIRALANEMGVRLSYNRGYYIAEESPLPQLALTSIEQLVLTLALQNLPWHLDKDLEDIANSILNKLLDRPVRVDGIVVEGEPLKGAKPGVFSRLESAIEEHRWVTLVEYHKLINEVIWDRRVEPYALAFRERAWYLVAYTPSSGKFQRYRLDRIRKLRVEQETFSPRPFDVEEHFRGSLGVMVDRPQRMRARFTGLAKEIVKKDGRFPEKDMQEDGKGLILDTIINGEIQWLRWLIGFGGEAEILEPPELRQKAIRMLKEGLQRYGEW